MSEMADHPRRQSIMPPRDSDGFNMGSHLRRFSRLDARPSIQYGLSGRRMSQFSRSSFSGLSFGLKEMKVPVQLQNTYRLRPDPGDMFQAHKAEKVMAGVLESYLGGEKYNTAICSSLAQQISDVIKGRVKDMGFSSRYKFVCSVIIGQNKHQGVAVASRSVWNPETDNFASASFSSGDLFAVANIFATYFE